MNSELDERKVEANIAGLTALNACMALQQLVHIICGWKNRQKLVKMMNGWRNTSFVPSSQSNFVGENLRYYALVGLGVAYNLLFTASSIRVSFNVPPHPNRATEVAYLSLLLSYWPITENLQDALVILMLYELSTYYKQVRLPSLSINFVIR